MFSPTGTCFTFSSSAPVPYRESPIFPNIWSAGEKTKSWPGKILSIPVKIWQLFSRWRWYISELPLLEGLDWQICIDILYKIAHNNKTADIIYKHRFYSGLNVGQITSIGYFCMIRILHVLLSRVLKLMAWCCSWRGEF